MTREGEYHKAERAALIADRKRLETQRNELAAVLVELVGSTNLRPDGATWSLRFDRARTTAFALIERLGLRT